MLLCHCTETGYGSSQQTDLTFVVILEWSLIRLPHRAAHSARVTACKESSQEQSHLPHPEDHNKEGGAGELQASLCHPQQQYLSTLWLCNRDLTCVTGPIKPILPAQNKFYLEHTLPPTKRTVKTTNFSLQAFLLDCFESSCRKICLLLITCHFYLPIELLKKTSFSQISLGSIACKYLHDARPHKYANLGSCVQYMMYLSLAPHSPAVSMTHIFVPERVL